MQEQISHTLSFSLSLLKTANLRAAEHNPFPLMSEEKTWWMTVKESEKPEKPFGAPQDQKYSKHIKKPVMWWVTLAYWRSEGERALGGWIRAAHPTVEGGQERKKKLEISRGDYCQGQDRCRGREEIKRRSFQKNAGLLLATIPLFFSLLFFSWVHPLSKSVIISELFSSPHLPSGFNTMFTLPNFTYVFSPFLVVPFSRIASKCDYKYRTHSAPPCVPPATMRIMENLNPQLLLMRLVVSLSRCSHRERFSF